MKTLTLQQLIAIQGHFENGNIDFKQKLKVCNRPLGRLWRWLCNPENKYLNTTEINETIYRFTFEDTAYNRDRLIKLKAQLRETLTDFIELQKVRSTSQGQNIIAELYEDHGHTEKADEVNKESLRLATKEPEPKQWYATFYAYKALFLRNADNKLATAKQALILSFLTNYLKLSIEELTLFRIEQNKGVISEASRKEIQQVFKLLPDQIPPIIAIQAKAVEYFVNPNLERYQAFKAVFLQKIDLAASDKKHLLIYILNAIALYPNPSEEIIREYLPLYREGIERELFTVDDNLEMGMVCNILVVADALRDYELIKLTNKKLIPLLADKKKRKCCSLLAEAYIHFGNQEFEQALSKIKNLEDLNSRYFEITLRKHILKLKCLNDISESNFDAFDKIQDARKYFDKFLIRNLKNKNINLATKESCTNFINMVVKIRSTHNKKYTKSQLLSEVHSLEFLMDRKWLKEKIAERPF